MEGLVSGGLSGWMGLERGEVSDCSRVVFPLFFSFSSFWCPFPLSLHSCRVWDA